MCVDSYNHHRECILTVYMCSCCGVWVCCVLCLWRGVFCVLETRGRVLILGGTIVMFAERSLPKRFGSSTDVYMNGFGGSLLLEANGERAFGGNLERTVNGTV